MEQRDAYTIHLTDFLQWILRVIWRRWKLYLKLRKWLWKSCSLCRLWGGCFLLIFKVVVNDAFHSKNLWCASDVIIKLCSKCYISYANFHFLGFEILDVCIQYLRFIVVWFGFGNPRCRQPFSIKDLMRHVGLVYKVKQSRSLLLHMRCFQLLFW